MPKTTMDLVQAAKQEITELSTENAKQLLSEGSIALDVREPQEYQSDHISNSHHIPRGMLEFMIDSHPGFQNKDTSIIVYCKTGGRSALATATLQQLGFSNVYSLAGGFDTWD
ncbi:MAG: rhodanese-like domain-containing protein [Methylophagaceae bacterium]